MSKKTVQTSNYINICLNYYQRNDLEKIGFHLGLQIYVQDNFFYLNLDIYPMCLHYGEAINISKIPLSCTDTNLKKLALIIKCVFAEYIKNIYNNGVKNFKINKPVDYTLNYKGKIINSKFLKNKTLRKYLKYLENENCNFFKNDNFCIYDKFHDLGSVDIEEPFHYTELLYIQTTFPTIYSLLEKNCMIYSKYRKLSREYSELVRIYGDQNLSIHEFNLIAQTNMNKLGLEIDSYCCLEEGEKINVDNLNTILKKLSKSHISN